MIMSVTVLTYKTIFTNIAMRPQLDVISVYYIIKELLKLTMTIIFYEIDFFYQRIKGIDASWHCAYTMQVPMYELRPSA